MTGIGNNNHTGNPNTEQRALPAPPSLVRMSVNPQMQVSVSKPHNQETDEKITKYFLETLKTETSSVYKSLQNTQNSTERLAIINSSERAKSFYDVFDEISKYNPRSIHEINADYTQTPRNPNNT
jgi:flagellar hook-basal body complex protein FliE